MKKISKRNVVFCVMMTLMLVLIAVVCVTASTAKAVEEIEENLNADKAWVIDNFGEDVWNDIEEDIVNIHHEGKMRLAYEVVVNDVPDVQGVFVLYCDETYGFTVAVIPSC